MMNATMMSSRAAPPTPAITAILVMSSALWSGDETSVTDDDSVDVWGTGDDEDDIVELAIDADIEIDVGMMVVLLAVMLEGCIEVGVLVFVVDDTAVYKTWWRLKHEVELTEDDRLTHYPQAYPSVSHVASSESGLGHADT